MRHLKFLVQEHSLDPRLIVPINGMLTKAYGLKPSGKHHVDYAAYSIYEGIEIGMGFIEHGISENGQNLESMLLAQKDNFNVLIGQDESDWVEYCLIHNTGDVRHNFIFETLKGKKVHLTFLFSSNSPVSDKTVMELISGSVRGLFNNGEYPIFPEVVRLALNSASQYSRQMQSRFL